MWRAGARSGGAGALNGADAELGGGRGDAAQWQQQQQQQHIRQECGCSTGQLVTLLVAPFPGSTLVWAFMLALLLFGALPATLLLWLCLGVIGVAACLRLCLLSSSDALLLEPSPAAAVAWSLLSGGDPRSAAAAAAVSGPHAMLLLPPTHPGLLHLAAMERDWLAAGSLFFGSAKHNRLTEQDLAQLNTHVHDTDCKHCSLGTPAPAYPRLHGTKGAAGSSCCAATCTTTTTVTSNSSSSNNSWQPPHQGQLPGAGGGSSGGGGEVLTGAAAIAHAYGLVGFGAPARMPHGTTAVSAAVPLAAVPSSSCQQREQQIHLQLQGPLHVPPPPPNAAMLGAAAAAPGDGVLLHTAAQAGNSGSSNGIAAAYAAAAAASGTAPVSITAPPDWTQHAPAAAATAVTVATPAATAPSSSSSAAAAAAAVPVTASGGAGSAGRSFAVQQAAAAWGPRSAFTQSLLDAWGSCDSLCALDDDDAAVCSICLGGFREGALVTTLPCRHAYHKHCVVPWLLQQGRASTCPMCKAQVFRG